MLSERMQAATLDDAPAYWFLNALHILMARTESAGGAYSLIHLTTPPAFATPYHVHHTEDEAFYVGWRIYRHLRRKENGAQDEGVSTDALSAFVSHRYSSFQ